LGLGALVVVLKNLRGILFALWGLKCIISVLYEENTNTSAEYVKKLHEVKEKINFWENKY